MVTSIAAQVITHFIPSRLSNPYSCLFYEQYYVICSDGAMIWNTNNSRDKETLSRQSELNINLIEEYQERDAKIPFQILMSKYN